jgi:NCS1 family nucleobase:cation symporter-1
VESATPSWGITPVPERLRVLGLLDTTLLWANLSVSLLVIVAGGLLVPALSLPAALGAILVGALVGNLMLAFAGAIGADARVPGMVVLRAPLGRRGSYVPTVLNVAQNLGWSTFELLIIATAAGALSKRVFGFEGLWLWKLAFGGVAIVLALMGPVGFVRRYVRKFAVWVVLASLVYLTWWTLARSDLQTFWHASGEGGFPTFGQGVDLVLASVVSWTPLAADYTRFSRDRRSAFLGAGVGYFVPTLWMFGLGALLLLARGIDDAAAIPAAVAAGGVVSVLALLALTVDESDEAFADVYSTAVSMQNVLTRASQRVLIVLVAVAATTLTFVIDLRDYSTFLYLLGSFFVPLFGVLLADWLLRGMHYREEDVFGAPAFRPGPLAAWLAGFALYQWLSPNGPEWWTSLVEHVHPAHVGFTASVPSLGLAIGLCLLFEVLARRRPAAASLARTR